MFVGIISGKPSRDSTRPLGIPRGLKGLLHMLNATVHPMKAGFIFMFSVYFLFCIAKGLAICKFGGVISAECCTFKPLNSHLLIP
jgi:hypothetical protein